MKIFRRALYGLLVVCLLALFAALFGRMYIQEYYPKDSLRIVFTDSLTDHYNATEDFKVYTQKIRAPYDDNKNACFFAKGLYLIPDAQTVQVTMRYNDQMLDAVAAKYKLESLEPKEGLFRYTLTVSYNQDEDGTDFRTYDAVYSKESSAFLYHYNKLVFEGVDFENAAWMRVDVYLVGEEEAYGAVTVYEANFEYNGELFPYEMKEEKIAKRDLPK